MTIPIPSASLDFEFRALGFSEHASNMRASVQDINSSNTYRPTLLVLPGEYVHRSPSPGFRMKSRDLLIHNSK